MFRLKKTELITILEETKTVLEKGEALRTVCANSSHRLWHLDRYQNYKGAKCRKTISVSIRFRKWVQDIGSKYYGSGRMEDSYAKSSYRIKDGSKYYLELAWDCSREDRIKELDIFIKKLKKEIADAKSNKSNKKNS